MTKTRGVLPLFATAAFLAVSPAMAESHYSPLPPVYTPAPEGTKPGVSREQFEMAARNAREMDNNANRLLEQAAREQRRGQEEQARANRDRAIQERTRAVDVRNNARLESWRQNNPSTPMPLLETPGPEPRR